MKVLRIYQKSHTIFSPNMGHLLRLPKAPLGNSSVHHPIPINNSCGTNHDLPPRRLLRSDEPQRRNLREGNPAQEEDVYGLCLAIPTKRLPCTGRLIVALLNNAERRSTGTLDHILKPKPSWACRAGLVHRGRGAWARATTFAQGKDIRLLQDALDQADAEGCEAAVYVGDILGVFLADFLDNEAKVLAKVVVVGLNPWLGTCGWEEHDGC